MEYITLTNSYAMMLVRLVISIAFTWLIIDKLYYAKSHRRDFRFTFMLIPVAIFFIVFFMIFVLEDMKGKTSMGVGIGLFGIFSIMRYRTDTMPVREMTYLFVIIALAAANGLAPVYQVVDVATAPHYVISWGSVGVMALVNALIILLVAVLESESLVKHTTTKLVLYDRIELIVPERRAELVADLEKRLGVQVENVEIGHVDFLKDAAFIKVYYNLPKGEANSVNMVTRAKDYVA